MENALKFILMGATCVIVVGLMSAVLIIQSNGVDNAKVATSQLSEVISNDDFMLKYDGQVVNASIAKEMLERAAGQYNEVLHSNGTEVYELIVFDNDKLDSYLDPRASFYIHVERDGENVVIVEVADLRDKQDRDCIGTYDLAKAKAFRETWISMAEMIETEQKISDCLKMIIYDANIYAELKACKDSDNSLANTGNIGDPVPTYTMVDGAEADYEESVEERLHKELNIKSGNSDNSEGGE